MARPLLQRILRRRRQLCVHEPLKQVGRRRERRMRTNKPDKQHPRLLARRPRGVFKPADRLVRNPLVVIEIAAPPRPRLEDRFAGAFAGRHVVSDRPHHIADAVHHIQRNALLLKTFRRAGAFVMQLPDRFDPMPFPREASPPPFHRAVVREGVVPISDLMNVPARREAGARRNADRAVRVCVGKARSARRERVQIRRERGAVAVRAHRVPPVLVRENEEQIGRLHRRLQIAAHTA